MKIWLVGQLFDDKTDWEVVGVFDTQDAAEAACVDENYFVGPLTLNEVSNKEHEEWVGAYKPKA